MALQILDNPIFFSISLPAENFCTFVSLWSKVAYFKWHFYITVLPCSYSLFYTLYFAIAFKWGRQVRTVRTNLSCDFVRACSKGFRTYFRTLKFGFLYIKCHLRVEFTQSTVLALFEPRGSIFQNRFLTSDCHIKNT